MPKNLVRSLIVVLALAPAGRLLAQQDDSVLDAAERQFRQALDAAQDKQVARDSDAGQIFSAIRSTRDPDVLPLFNKLRQSKSLENQIFAMTAAAVLTKDPNQVDMKLLLSTQDNELIGTCVFTLINEHVLTADQLKALLVDDKEASQRVMIAAELADRKALPDRRILDDFLKSDSDQVRYYAAITMLDGVDPSQVEPAMAALKSMSQKHELRQAIVQALMIERVCKQKLTGALPWILQVATDDQNDMGLRYTAVAALLSFKSPEAPGILSGMIATQTDVGDQIKLALIATEFGSQLTPKIIEPLTKSHSNLVKETAELAMEAANGKDNLAGLLALIKEGQPIVMDWALAYTDRIEGDRRVAIRTAVVNQAIIVDGARERDYERAVAAAQELLDDDGAAGRTTVAGLLNSTNRAVVEAALAGIYRSDAKNQAALVLPIWPGLTKTTSTEIAANFAALILAREKRPEPVTWLPGMIMGGTIQGPGYRALAGWYYAKLKGQSDGMMKRLVAN